MWRGQINFDGLSELDLKEEINPVSYRGGIGELILLILIFILIIIACYFVTKFIGGKQIKQMKNSNFTVLDTYRITQNKFLQLVRMGNEYVVIAVTKDAISVITHLVKEEIVTPNSKPTEGASFKHILSDIVNKKKSEEKVDMK